MKIRIVKVFSASIILLSLSACNGSGGFLLKGSATTPPNYLYVASGACYGGGVTTNTGLATIARYGLADAQIHGSTINYYTQSQNDQPAGILSYDANNLLVLVENAAGRRLDLASKVNPGQLSVFTQSAVILAGVGHGIGSSSAANGGGFYVARTAAVEKVAPNKTRITAGANPYINAPAAPCATSTTNMTGIIELPLGKLVYIHGAATPNNRIGMIKATGYAVATDCTAGLAGPTTTALPTAIIQHHTGKILVAYGSTTSASNIIMSYDVNEAAGTITNPITAYTNPSVINGPSAMVEDPATGNVYISNSVQGAETIEQFTFDSVTGLLTRVGSQPFINVNQYIRCVAGMAVTN